MIKKLQLRRLSMCPCGFPTLAESIELGTVYEVDLLTMKIDGFMYRCGGCGGILRLMSVDASQQIHPDRPKAALPFGLFFVESNSHKSE